MTNSKSTEDCLNERTTDSSSSADNNDRRKHAFDQRSASTGISTHHVFSSSIRHNNEMLKLLKGKSGRCIIYPWSKFYRLWFALTVLASVVTIFNETYEIAFGSHIIELDAGTIIFVVLEVIFVIDMIINFNLALIDEKDAIVYNKKEIAKNYARLMLWVDAVGVFPFYMVAVAIAGSATDETSRLNQYLSLLRLFRLVRLHRVKQTFDILQHSSKISLLWLTLIRNISVALVWTHFAACTMYFIAKQYSFDEDKTWIGGSLEYLNGVEKYLTSLYWSVVTFTTVGYGDFSPVNPAEQIWGMVYMLLNIILHSWIIGSITLLIVKADEKTGLYRETLEKLDQYSSMHSFDSRLHRRLKKQVKLEFNNREVADENVLKHFPNAVRCKILRKLYLSSLVRTSLMEGVRQQFVDAFLTTCNVEMFSPGEEILQRGSISSDLFLLVEGVVDLFSADDEMNKNKARSLNAGDFINEIAFFTESPQIDTVRTVGICKTLTMPRSAYKAISEDHPGSVGKILQNLLVKVERIAEENVSQSNASLPKPLEVLKAGSAFDSFDASTRRFSEIGQTIAAVQTEAALTAVRDLVKMHINKQKDNQTMRFLFAASRGDTATITLMCDQGFDPNSADYDARTGMMVASMKGNTETVSKLLECGANPNLVDVHGSSSLYEAVRNCHDDTLDELLRHDAKLCMNENLEASTLCQAVFDGDILMLRRLLRAQIQVDACDYDKRTAAHIAAAEGNVVAMKVLVEFGADLMARDRWQNTIYDEAKKANAGQLLDYLESNLPANSYKG